MDPYRSAPPITDVQLPQRKPPQHFTLRQKIGCATFCIALLLTGYAGESEAHWLGYVAPFTTIGLLAMVFPPQRERIFNIQAPPR